MIFYLRFIERNWLAITLVILLLVTSLSLTPLAELPAVPGSDKTHHLIAYSSLAFPVMLARYRYRFILLTGFFFWSGCIEVLQPLVNRYAEWLDLFANGIGLMLGALVASRFSTCLIIKSRSDCKESNDF